MSIQLQVNKSIGSPEYCKDRARYYEFNCPGIKTKQGKVRDGCQRREETVTAEPTIKIIYNFDILSGSKLQIELLEDELYRVNRSGLKNNTIHIGNLPWIKDDKRFKIVFLATKRTAAKVQKNADLFCDKVQDIIMKVNSDSAWVGTFK